MPASVSSSMPSISLSGQNAAIQTSASGGRLLANGFSLQDNEKVPFVVRISFGIDLRSLKIIYVSFKNKQKIR